jgi:Cdc6-like AAA superfamily ATPase
MSIEELVMSINIVNRCRTTAKRNYIRLSFSKRVLNKLYKTLAATQSNIEAGMIITGQAGQGKSTIVQYFAKEANKGMNNKFGVVRIEIPTLPSVKSLYNQIVKAFNEPAINPKAGILEHRNGAEGLVQEFGTKMLIIDEFDYTLSLIKKGYGIDLDEMVKELKYIINKYKIAVVLVGADDANNVTSISTQISSRFDRPVVIPTINMNDKDLMEDFRFFIKEYSRVNEITFDSSLNFDDDIMILRTYLAAAGDYRTLVRLLADAKFDAFAMNDDIVSLDILADAYGLDGTVTHNGITVLPFFSEEKDIIEALHWTKPK